MNSEEKTAVILKLLQSEQNNVFYCFRVKSDANRRLLLTPEGRRRRRRTREQRNPGDLQVCLTDLRSVLHRK